MVLPTWLDKAEREVAMMTKQSRRQRADQIMDQVAREIRSAFPQLQVDMFDTGPEQEDGLVLVHISEPDTFDEVWQVVGKLLTDAIINEDLLIALRSERIEP